MQNSIPIPVLLEDDASAPSYSSEHAAGADIKAYIKEPVVIQPHQRALIPTGVKVEIPYGFEIQVRPRSGLAFKNGISVLNTPGTIDCDYRGEIGVILINHGTEPFTVEPGMRIAQILLTPVFHANFIVAEALSTTVRGHGGFGHTGISG
jgi:dUTP pyrophosphatase